jgi:hypothetical protein
MPRKGKRLKRLKPGQLLGSATANELIDFFNAFMAIKIVRGSSDDVLIGDLAILLKFKSSSATGDGSSSYRGEYSPDGITPLNPGPFLPGDIVRVTPTNALSVPEGGDIIPGVYVCILEGATEADVPNHPLSDGGETSFWHCLATYPSLRDTCDETGEIVSTIVDAQDLPAP